MRSISATLPSYISKIKLTRLFDKFTTFGCMRAEILPMFWYAEIINLDLHPKF